MLFFFFFDKIYSKIFWGSEALSELSIIFFKKIHLQFFFLLPDTLINRKCQLKELSVPHLHADRYWRADYHRERLLASLAKFLRNQHSLQTFDIPNAGLSVSNGIKILDGLVIGLKATRKLRVLNLEDFFHARLTIFRVGKFLHCLNSIQQLNSLYINYNCLCNDAIEILTRTCAATLKFFSIKIYKNDPHFQKIDSFVWQGLRNACPGLRVNVYFECIGQFTTIRRILCHVIPLYSLQIWGGVHHPDEIWNIADMIRYLADNFSSTLGE